MANNRMWLRHKKTGKQVLLAKYYPSQGWYCFHDDLNLNLDQLFMDLDHLEGSHTGENNYEIVYESESPDESIPLSKQDYEKLEQDARRWKMTT